MTQPAAPPVCYRHPGVEAHIQCQRCGRYICPDCMRSASVGFQCPECVKEGARSTRSGRTAYGGLRSGNPALTSQVLIGLNVLVWLLIVSTGGNTSRWVYRLALLPTSFNFGTHGVGSVHYRGVADGAYWQLVTSMFTHVNLLHIGFNMVALWVLGPQLEAAVGRTRFLGLYFLSGLCGSAAVYWFAPEIGVTLGASGAIFGLLGALLIIAYKVGGDVQGLLAWIVLNFVITFTASNISWEGHLGGFVGGVLLGGILAYAPRERRSALQAAGFAAVTILVIVAVLARTAVLS
jgi:membrane associated rhomboid family serine protease